MIERWKRFVTRMWAEERTLSIIILAVLGLMLIGFLAVGAWWLFGVLFGGAASATAPVLADNMAKARQRKLEDDKRDRDTQKQLVEVTNKDQADQRRHDAAVKKAKRDEKDANKKVDAMDDDQRTDEFSRLAKEFRKGE